jgi:hypothetical protein
MTTTRFKLKIGVMASLFTIGMVGIASARPTYGGTCISCHNSTGKTPSEMNWAPANLVLAPSDSGSVTFNVTSLGTSGGEGTTNPRSAISLQGLENALLNATIAAGGNWTLFSESHGTSYNSDSLTAPGLGSYVLNFTIGANAANGNYPIGVSLAASGGGGSAFRTGFNTTPGFTITVVPEPTAAALLCCGLAATALYARRRRFGTAKT